MPYAVVFTPETEAQLVNLYGFIAQKASPEIAARFTDTIITYCESLSIFPLRGVKRDDVRPGLRITHYKKRVAIAFHVNEAQGHIVGIFYGGRNYESVVTQEE
jgi:toxin ParE1/3/4